MPHNLALVVVLCFLFLAVSGPSDRPVTDPHSIHSMANPSAGPVAIDNLFSRKVTGPAWSPDGKSIVFQQDHGGGKIYDLFSIPAAGGEAVNLTQADDISETGPVFSPNGHLLALS